MQRRVADLAMATDATESLAGVRRVLDGVNNVAVALAAGVFRDALVHRPGLDGVMKIAGRELERVPKAILRLGVVLGEEPLGGVAIVAGRDLP
jgi:hypothetical protein